MQLGEGEMLERQQDGSALKPGDKGYRLHAAIPMPSKMNFSLQPNNPLNAYAEELRKRGGPKEEMSRLERTLKDKQMARKKKTEGIVKVSIEGRGMG